MRVSYLSAFAFQSLAFRSAVISVAVASFNCSAEYPRSEAMDFARVAALALSREPARDGGIRPNYLMASAAEEKRRAAEGGGAAGSPADGGGTGG